VDIWNTNPGLWQGRTPNVLAPLTCCVQNDDGNVYPPTINDLSPSCLYNGTVPSDYYQPVCRHCLLESNYKHVIYVYVENTHRVDYIFTGTSTENTEHFNFKPYVFVIPDR